MFGISLWELSLVIVVGLLVFGPEKLPELARTLGQLSGELRKTTDYFRREFYNAIYTPSQEIEATVKRELTSLTADTDCETYVPPEEKKQADTEGETPTSDENKRDKGKEKVDS